MRGLAVIFWACVLNTALWIAFGWIILWMIKPSLGGEPEISPHHFTGLSLERTEEPKLVKLEAFVLPQHVVYVQWTQDFVYWDLLDFYFHFNSVRFVETLTLDEEEMFFYNPDDPIFFRLELQPIPVPVITIKHSVTVVL